MVAVRGAETEEESALVSLLREEITDEEARFFQEHGWVELPHLISEAAASELRRRIQALMGERAELAHFQGERDAYSDRFHQWGPLAVDVSSGDVVDPVFFDCSHARTMGDLGSKLMGEPVRYWMDEAIVKRPVGSGETGTGPTAWHRDIGSRDESPFWPGEGHLGELTVWIAVEEIPAERATMRFVSPKDIDDDVLRIVDKMEIQDSYSELGRRGILSPPLDLRAGDATAHGSLTLHSAPRNTTDEPRWTYIVTLFPAESTYTGAVKGSSTWPFEGVQGLQVGATFPDDRFRPLG